MPPFPTPHLHRKITRLYLLALSAVAFLSVGGQWLIQQSLKSQLHDSRIINVAGRQRMLSQKISKQALLLVHSPNLRDIGSQLKELDSTLVTWENSHYGLKKGKVKNLSTPVQNSPALQAKYAALEPFFQNISKNARAISTHLHQNPTSEQNARLRSYLDTLLRNEPHYLKGMEEVVLQYDQEANERVNQSRQLESLLLWLTLGVLALEALFIFRPAVQQIKDTISKLISAEQETKDAHQELMQVHHTLTQTQAALLEGTKAQLQKEMDAHKTRSMYLMEGQEEERKRIALELHDGLGQMLTALKFCVEKVGDSVNVSAPAQQDLRELKELVKQTIAETRAISFDLMPAVLLDFGLASALKLLASQTSSRTGLTVTFTTNWTGKRLPKNVETGLYRISQEALQNALKYAGAQTITIDLSAKTKYIHLRIVDDGQGFELPDLETEASDPTHGFSNMKERVHLLNGNIQIISRPGQGTQIHVKIPHLAPTYD